MAMVKRNEAKNIMAEIMASMVLEDLKLADESVKACSFIG